jgi:hypothetical protein
MSNTDININVKDNIFNNNKSYLFINLSNIISSYTLELYSDDNSLIIKSDIKVNSEKIDTILSFEIDLGNNYFIKISYQKNENTGKNIFHKFIYPNDYLKDNINFVIKKKKEEVDKQSFFNPFISEDNKSNNNDKFNNLFFYCDEDSYDSNINNYLIDQNELSEGDEVDTNEIMYDELSENDIIDISEEINQTHLDISNNNYNSE